MEAAPRSEVNCEIHFSKFFNLQYRAAGGETHMASLQERLDEFKKIPPGLMMRMMGTT
jgi:hypothetical protein